MEEDLTTPDDPAESDFNIIEVEDDKDAVKEFVSKHLKEMAAHSPGQLYSDPEETSMEDSASHNKTARKSPKKSQCKVQQGAVFSGKILSFGCSECKDDATYSPNDLLKHFQGVHKGSLPTYPCDLCGFVTNEFPALQRHRIGHRNTLVTCEICNNDVQYSLLLLTRHFIMCHSLNGHFHCEKCEFSTTDAGTFVQHIHHHNESRIKCVKCQYVSSSRSEHQKHLKVHSGTFPFTCQVCGYGAARREYLSKHMVTVHGEEVERKNVWRAIEDGNNTLTNSSTGLKLLLKKSPSAGGASKESQWMSKHNSLPGVGLLDQNGRLFNSEKTLEETVGSKKDSKKWNKGIDKHDQQSQSQAMSSVPSPPQESDNSFGADAVSPNSNGLTVLMVKNKISLPPNCTTKVMGFKMVDGKKHLVLKVIPTAKLDCSSLLAEQETGFSTSDKTSDGSRHSADSAGHGENSRMVCQNSPYLAVSQRSGSPYSQGSGQTSTSGTYQDVIATEVKVEEEESIIRETMHFLEEQEETDRGNLSKGQSNVELSPNNQQKVLKATQCENTASSTTKESDPPSMENGHPKNSLSLNCDKSQPLFSNKQQTKSPDAVLRSKISASDVSAPCTSMIDRIAGPVSSAMVLPAVNMLAGVSTRLKVSQKNMPPSQVSGDASEVSALSTTTNNIESLIPDSPRPGTVISEREPSTDKHERKSSNSTFCEHSPEKTDSNSIENPANQEVFSFHNYSKETSSISTNSTQPFETPLELSTEDESAWTKESPEWSLTLAASPQPLTEQGTEERSEKGQIVNTEEAVTSIERVSDSDIEVDECIAAIEDLGTPMLTEKENHEFAHQDHTVVKLEEECACVSEKPTGSKSTLAALGRIVEEHSDAIISHQLEKERVVFSTVGLDSARPSKTTLRILQTPEGKQQMFLQTAENRYAFPMQLKGNSGFKLITKSSTPQINVSYVKPGIERQTNPSGLALTLNSGRISMSTPGASASQKGPKLMSAIQPGASTSASHYLVNTALKSPLVLSGTAQGTPSEKTMLSQPACYLVQRPLPIAQVLSNPGSSQSPLSSRPVLAMPVTPADKSKTLQTGRQAFLVRYISPAKSGNTVQNQPSESRGNKVVLKIVRTANGILSGGAPTTANQSIFLTTGSSQTPCFLLSNKCSANTPTGLRTFIPIQNSAQRPVSASSLLNIQPNAQSGLRLQAGIDVQKSHLAPRPIRPPSQRKRRRKALFDELPEPVSKSRRLTSKALPEKGGPSVWVPVPKEAERTLKLSPFTSLQQVKCPRRNQPVVVLNHPDVDIPEVTSIMRSVNKYKGAVSKVALSRKTVQALSELGPLGGQRLSMKCHSSQSIGLRPRLIESSARERFILKMKLRKMTKKKYEVVNSSSSAERPLHFSCWFCGRLFDNQEDWIGHGQRHLMEATRDWNKLF